MMANIPICTIATTAVTTTAYATTISMNNNKLHNINFDNYKIFVNYSFLGNSPASEF